MERGAPQLSAPPGRFGPSGPGNAPVVAYTFRRDEPVDHAVRRIAHDQVERALTDLRDPERIGVEEAVHDCRKRCKKLRGLVRLARPALGKDYARANRGLRDAARELSDLRDDQALLATFETLLGTHRDQFPDGGVDPVLDRLRSGAERATERVRDEGGERVARATALLEREQDRIDDWSFSGACVSQSCGRPRWPATHALR
ncbi:MAG: CHAD domain-containing protein [Actinomycetota bacterium]|nr:CHAD domain-containing protein [Actinomycetota bacterium]